MRGSFGGGGAGGGVAGFGGGAVAATGGGSSGDFFSSTYLGRASDYERFLRIDFVLSVVVLLVVLGVYARYGARFRRESAAGRADRADRVHVGIDLRAQPEQQDRRALEDHPLLRHLKRVRELAEGDVELLEVCHRLQLRLHVHLDVLE